MENFRPGVVITAGPGRLPNVEACLESLDGMGMQPELAVLVLDGHEERPRAGDQVRVMQVPKHEPGMEQPRNAGVRALRNLKPDLTHVWFLDSDIIVYPHALEEYASVFYRVQDLTDYDPILIGPYDWMPPGMREPDRDLRTDFRWEMFEERGHKISIAHLGVALGCFGGNLVWPIDEFIRVGGFHPQLHHGRCEDGELGLRAASHRIPMILVPEARGWHLFHDTDTGLAVERNARDVPLLNQWHPWVEEKGLVVTDQDGARFEFVCSCGAQVNTLEMWDHMASHGDGLPQPDLTIEDRPGDPSQPVESLILPEGM